MKRTVSLLSLVTILGLSTVLRAAERPRIVKIGRAHV